MSEYKDRSESEYIASEIKNDEKWIVQPVEDDDSHGSWAAKFLIVIAAILFVGGAIISFAIATTEVEKNRMTQIAFDWIVFFESYLTYALAGCFALCSSELFKNIQRIADSLEYMEIRKKPRKENRIKKHLRDK